MGRDPLVGENSVGEDSLSDTTRTQDSDAYCEGGQKNQIDDRLQLAITPEKDLGSNGEGRWTAKC